MPGRVQRGDPPAKRLRRGKHRDALPELMRDFRGRCAYSMQHWRLAGGMRAMEIDHFNPRQKKDVIQRYENLLLATRHCNGSKGRNWPNPAELAAGCRFLNPCEEVDYGEVIFEDPNTHLLIGRTPAAIWHIRILDLNAPHLIEERRNRADIGRLLSQGPITIKGSGLNDGDDAILKLVELAKDMIPHIPAPPADRIGTSGAGHPTADYSR